MFSKKIIFLALSALLLYAEDPIIQTPSGGWNYAGLTDNSERAYVAYPTPPIERGNQKYRTMIKGAIKSTKERKPLLIVNGTPMSLNTDENGNYSRFYAFGAGSNSIEVSAQHGKKVQFYEANPNKAAAKLRIVCTWDSPETEIDMHIITPDGQHSFYGHPCLREGGGLDGDSVDGPGPEMFTSIAPMRGAYHVYINYWGNYSMSEGYNFDRTKLEKPIVTAQVTLIFYENTVNEKRETFTIPLRKIGDINLVKSFVF